MIKRIVDVSSPAYLSVKNEQLLVTKDGEVSGSIPVEDLGVLILQHPACVITQQAVIACQRNNAAILFCDEKRLPYSVALPIATGNIHTKVVREQIAVKKTVQKRIWQQIVRQKIVQQATTLRALNKDDAPLWPLAKEVKTNDNSNREALAAQAYWPLLFGADFIRDPDAEGVNGLLNYGYSLVRAMVARSICGAGLHPSLGIFHRNQYNPLVLADDLMEPFRPWVDRVVYKLSSQATDSPLTVSRETKKPLLELLSAPVARDGQRMPLMVACHYLMADLKRCYTEQQRDLAYPALAEEGMKR